MSKDCQLFSNLSSSKDRRSNRSRKTQFRPAGEFLESQPVLIFNLVYSGQIKCIVTLFFQAATVTLWLVAQDEGCGYIFP